jgi:uncharacterized phage protein (TIGR02220 family)
MANPQPTDSHLRLAVTIQNELTLRDFTKRQYKIINLILRVSWACGKKFAVIPQYTRYFKACGLHKQDIKKELDTLTKNKVISWEQSTNLFEFNKNFDEWLIPYHPESNKFVIQELINMNLKSKQNTYSVSETRTEYENNTYSVSENNLLLEAENQLIECKAGSPITNIITNNYNISTCEEILTYLNEKANKQFKPTDSNLKFIKARLQNYSIEELKAVVDFKVKEWQNNPTMKRYLRPETLFNATKCGGYVEESREMKEVKSYAYNGFA